jgi:hypothetical protein
LSVTKPFTGRVVVFGAASGESDIITHDLVFAHQVQLKDPHIGTLATAAPSVYRSLLVELTELIARGCTYRVTPRFAGRPRGRLCCGCWRRSGTSQSEDREGGAGLRIIPTFRSQFLRRA